jgi:hypothetical protein
MHRGVDSFWMTLGFIVAANRPRALEIKGPPLPGIAVPCKALSFQEVGKLPDREAHS